MQDVTSVVSVALDPSRPFTSYYSGWGDPDPFPNPALIDLNDESQIRAVKTAV